MEAKQKFMIAAEWAMHLKNYKITFWSKTFSYCKLSIVTSLSDMIVNNILQVKASLLLYVEKLHL